MSDRKPMGDRSIFRARFMFAPRLVDVVVAEFAESALVRLNLRLELLVHLSTRMRMRERELSMHSVPTQNPATCLI